MVTVCSQFDDGNALHIAAANLCYRSAVILIAHGADGGHRDSSNRLPYECIPSGNALLVSVKIIVIVHYFTFETVK